MTLSAPVLDFDLPEETQRAAPVKTTRVLHVINGEHYAGAERVQDLLALRLPDLGFEVGFACIKPERFPALRRSQASPLYAMPMRGKFDLRPALSLAGLVRREGYALIHTHTARSALIGRVAARLAGVPMVHHVHSPALNETTHRWRNQINAASERWSLHGAAALICVSESLGGYVHEKKLARRLCKVVPNGVPTHGPLVQRLRPTGDWTLGVVALFRPRKGLEVLLTALADLRDRGFPVRLRAVGTFETPAYESEIKQLTERLGIGDAVDWRGFTAHVDRELAAMDLFVLPSLFGEGLPMVILEAMAAGIPVVSTRVEGAPEAVREGVDGLIAEPGDPHSLAKMLLRVIDGQVDWQKLRASAGGAYRRQAQQFSDHSMAAGVAGVYREVLA